MICHEAKAVALRIAEECAFAQLHLGRVVRDIEFLFGYDSDELIEALRALQIVEQTRGRVARK